LLLLLDRFESGEKDGKINSNKTIKTANLSQTWNGLAVAFHGWNAAAVYLSGDRQNPGTTTGLYRVTSQESYQLPVLALVCNRSPLTGRQARPSLLPFHGLEDRDPQGSEPLELFITVQAGPALVLLAACPGIRE
jgi:hypothetical protein